MSSDVDICNLALARLGDEANVSSINPPDQSAQANYCHLFYPQAVQAMLDRHAWGFNTRRAILAELSCATLQWQHCYSLPSDFVNVITLTSLGIDTVQAYSVEVSVGGASVLYCNDSEVELVYSSSIVSASNFPPLFVDALSLLLAHYLAGPIVKGDVGVAASKSMLQLFQIALSLAINSDCQNVKRSSRFIPAGIAARV